MHNPRLIKALTPILESLNLNHSTLAALTGLDRAIVSLQFSGKRKVNHDHLLAYVSALPADASPALYAAWLADTAPPELLPRLLDFPGSANARLREEAATYSPALTAEENEALAWLAKELTTDTELHDWFFPFLRSIGYGK